MDTKKILSSKYIGIGLPKGRYLKKVNLCRSCVVNGTMEHIYHSITSELENIFLSQVESSYIDSSPIAF